MSLKSLYLGLIAVSLFGTYSALDNNPVLANTNYGYVLGSREYSRNSREYASFRGIPFAQPPVGDLRFQNPQRPKVWNSPYNATVDAAVCIQLFPFTGSIIGDEDCLYLNIYVPRIQNGSQSLLPVMVYIPGGGFTSGGGASFMYGPQYFMDKDVVLVTLNYRVGPFGFLSTLDDEAPGNFAFKDQVLALRFVNENINNFGGDKDRVTLFGESAGGASVGLQLVSPMSNGLFQQAIGQSGSALTSWALDNNEYQLNTTNTLATYIGCDQFIGDSQRLMQCFRNVDAEAIVYAMNNFLIFLVQEFSACKTVTETKTARNPDPFLEKSPYDYIKAGEFKKIPYIIGSNQDEGILGAGPILTQKALLEPFNANFDYLVPALLLFSGEENVSSLLNNVTEFYLGGDHFVNISNPSRIQGLIDALTDRGFSYATDQVILAQYSQGQESIWMYNLAYRGNFTVGSVLAPPPDVDIDFDWGVCHADDIQYFFISQNYFGPLEVTGKDLELSEIFLTMWTDFATVGNPDPSGNYSWDKLDFGGSNVTNENLNFLNITGSFASDSIEFVKEKGYNLERMHFWAEQKIRENSA